MTVKLTKNEMKLALTNYVKNKLINSSVYIINVNNDNILPSKGIDITVTEGKDK